MIKKIALTVFMTLASVHGWANIDLARANFEKNVQGSVKIDQIAATEMPGIYSIVVDQRIYYINEDAQHILAGSMVRLSDSVNLTEQLDRKINTVDWKKLPLKDAIKVIQGDGARQIAIFSDPNCPYCKQLEAEVAQLKNITVYTIILPFKSQSVIPSQQLYCLKPQERAAVWQRYIQQGVVPQGNQKCDHPLDQNLKIAKEMGVTGTPAIILSNGQKIIGAVSAQHLEALLSQMK